MLRKVKKERGRELAIGDVKQDQGTPNPTRLQFGTRWLPDIPDFRDDTINTEEITKMFRESTSTYQTGAGSVPAGR